MRSHMLDEDVAPASVIGLGTMIFHPDTTERDHALLDAFVEHGGTYIDTAEVYGAVEEHGYSEMVIGDWLADRPDVRSRIVLTTKGLIPGYCAPLHPGGATISPESIHRAIDGSLERLRQPSVDLWMLHRDDPTQPVGPLVEALDAEVRAGRILAYGGSNWSLERVAAARSYAADKGLAPMIAVSNHFSLAKANEPFWPDTVVTSEPDRQWLTDNQALLVAWSSLGRGFFARADRDDHRDADLVRVFYSDGNFERKARAELLAAERGLSRFEIGLAYVTSQSFPVVALAGPETVDEVASSTSAGAIELTRAECQWLDLSTSERPF